VHPITVYIFAYSVFHTQTFHSAKAQLHSASWHEAIHTTEVNLNLTALA